MTSSVLHLLNGDATLYLFKKSGITGKTAVWREVMCEGPTPATISPESLRTTRMPFICSFASENEEGYHRKVIEELIRLGNELNGLEELVLWFEYDWFCQANLMAALAYLQQNFTVLPAVSLVCIGDWPGAEKRLGLGEIAASDYPGLFENRIRLTAGDLAFARDFWEAFSAENPKKLLPLLDQVPEAFPYLAEATEGYFSLFPSVQNGLNVIEQHILHSIAEGFDEYRKLMRHLLLNQGIFGFGDLQYEVYLHRISPLLTIENEVYALNDLGKEVLAMKRDFLSLNPPEVFFGGAKASDFRYDVANHRLF